MRLAIMGLLDLIAAPSPERARQTLADLVRGPQNRLRGLLDSPVSFLTDALNDVVPTGQQAAEQLQRYQLPMSQDYAMGPSGYDNKLKDMALAGLTVYHGSPHKFDKFDMNKIGTGEGAQAYGHGLYLAESPAVAKEYGMTTKNGTFVNKLSYDGEIIQDNIRATAAKILKEAKGDKAAAIKEAQSYAYDNLLIPHINDLTPSRITAGNLYKVDLPDEAIAKMLDWDKTLDKQPRYIQNALTNVKDKLKMVDPLGNPAPQYGEPFGREIYQMLGNNELRQLGIPGIRYLDGGSRGTGSGTSNYVVFDDSLLKILERNGMPVP